MPRCFRRGSSPPSRCRCGPRTRSSGRLNVGSCESRAVRARADSELLLAIADQVVLAIQNMLDVRRDRVAQEPPRAGEPLPAGGVAGRGGRSRTSSASHRRSRGSSRAFAWSRGTDSTVLVTGETGTGKEVVVRAIHGLSATQGKILVKVNCAALPSRRDRERAVRTREGRLHGRSRAAGSAASSWRTGVRCSSTRSATCRWSCRRSCCAFSRRASSSASAEPQTHQGGRPDHRRDQPRSEGRRARKDDSAPTCSTASTCSRSRSRRCASGSRTFRA